VARTISARLPNGSGRGEAWVFMHRVLGARGSIQRGRRLYLLCVFAPVISLFLIIRVVPMAATLALAVTDYNWLQPGHLHFIGVENFLEMLQDPMLAAAWRNSLAFVVFSVPAIVIIAFVVAALINQRPRFEGLFQTLYFLPFILPTVPTAIIWRWIYAPGQFGLANAVLERLGLPPAPWLVRTDWAILAIVAMYVWKYAGLYVVLFLVGLKSIPQHIREAAHMDGAGAWQGVRCIDIPLMRPLFLYATVMGTIQAWGVFTEVYVMTQGTDVSAGTSVPVVALQVYQEAFSFYRAGYASAISLLLFIVSLLFVIGQLRVLQPKDAA
jgi:ABC-type sugar transport system permease subunit